VCSSDERFGKNIILSFMVVRSHVCPHHSIRLWLWMEWNALT
jgi:hypothetical protein